MPNLPLDRIIRGDALKVLQRLPAESIDCVVTSPPYWSLRDYGVMGQFGLEASPEEYIEQLCRVFDEVRRVLKPTGTCWEPWRRLCDTQRQDEQAAKAPAADPLAFI